MDTFIFLAVVSGYLLMGCLTVFIFGLLTGDDSFICIPAVFFMWPAVLLIGPFLVAAVICHTYGIDLHNRYESWRRFKEIEAKAKEQING